MITITEAARKTPVVHEADICVVGGSCTGVFAAVRAVRRGARVALIEKHNCFGGVATAGGVNVWHSLLDTRGESVIIGGLTAEILERLGKREAVTRGPETAAAYRLNTEELKIELDELVRENGVTPFLHSLYVAPVLRDGALDAVVVEGKSGRRAVRARFFIDATGDADLCRSLGLPMFDAGPLQPPTTCARLFFPGGGFAPAEQAALLREHGPEFGLVPDWGWGGSFPGLPGVQMRADTHVFGIDASDADQLTRAEIEGRRQVRAIMDLYRRYGPAQGAPVLSDLAAVIGVRETPRVIARYRLTGEDVLTGRRFPDAIANGSYPVDIHHADGAGITFRYLDGREETIPERGARPRWGRWREPHGEDPVFYQVPFRCLVQQEIPNLALAGRLLDADRVAFSAVRVMVNANQTGEAAGVACALACEKGLSVADVEPGLLRAELAAGGSVII